jgi:hypothetical protein
VLTYAWILVPLVRSRLAPAVSGSGATSRTREEVAVPGKAALHFKVGKELRERLSSLL